MIYGPRSIMHTAPVHVLCQGYKNPYIYTPAITQSYIEVIYTRDKNRLVTLLYVYTVYIQV
jgi:hypothetical protein